MENSTSLLKSASIEIKFLRRQNELMKARLDMFDSINAILHTQVATQSQGMSPDLAWEIDKFITNEEKQIEKYETPSIPTPKIN